MQLQLSTAANALGIRINVGYIAQLSDGSCVISQALLPDLGSARGTLVFSIEYKLSDAARTDLLAQGYALSSFSEPLDNELFEIDSYAEMFADWGWSGDENHKPKWI